ncbi:MAG: helix-turn-helix transcriptional regulator, partial [Sutterella sp.]
ASGLRNKDISVKLGIALRTVECHRANAFRKLGCRRAGDAKILLRTIGAETDPGTGDADADSADAG